MPDREMVMKTKAKQKGKAKPPSKKIKIKPVVNTENPEYVKMGRPTLYSEEVADAICEQIASSSKSLKSICSIDGMPAVRTVLSWLFDGEKTDGKQEHKDFLRKYARAREEQADFLAEEILDIADDGSNDLMTITKGDTSYDIENKEVTNRSKLRVEARKWIASKLKPKKYGDRITQDITSDGEKIGSIITTMIDGKIIDGKV